MWQSLAAYTIVAVAAAWVMWSVLVPRSWRTRLRTRVSGATASRDDDCGCGKS
jgi:hypothetical protein